MPNTRPYPIQNVPRSRRRDLDQILQTLAGHFSSIIGVRSQLAHIFPPLLHIVQSCLSNFCRFHSCRYAAVDRSLTDRFSYFLLYKTIVYGSSDIFAELWPAFQSDEYTDVLRSIRCSSSIKSSEVSFTHLASFAACVHGLAVTICCPNTIYRKGYIYKLIKCMYWYC